MTDVTVRVREGWAVFDGTAQRSGGDELMVPADLAGRWSIAGIDLLACSRPAPCRRWRGPRAT